MKLTTETLQKYPNVPDAGLYNAVQLAIKAGALKIEHSADNPDIVICEIANMPKGAQLRKFSKFSIPVHREDDEKDETYAMKTEKVITCAIRNPLLYGISESVSYAYEDAIRDAAVDYTKSHKNKPEEDNEVYDFRNETPQFPETNKQQRLVITGYATKKDFNNHENGTDIATIVCSEHGDIVVVWHTGRTSSRESAVESAAIALKNCAPRLAHKLIITEYNKTSRTISVRGILESNDIQALRDAAKNILRCHAYNGRIQDTIDNLNVNGIDKYYIYKLQNSSPAIVYCAEIV